MNRNIKALISFIFIIYPYVYTILIALWLYFITPAILSILDKLSISSLSTIKKLDYYIFLGLYAYLVWDLYFKLTEFFHNLIHYVRITYS